MADIMTPALGESVTEATVARWAKKPGEAVRKDEILVELETDKVSLEVASPSDGVLSRFANAEIVWCQEEPKNMGGWTFADAWLELTLSRLKVNAKRARYVGRPASASTAAGLMSRHLKELETFLAEALA